MPQSTDTDITVTINGVEANWVASNGGYYDGSIETTDEIANVIVKAKNQHLRLIQSLLQKQLIQLRYIQSMFNRRILHSQLRHISYTSQEEAVKMILSASSVVMWMLQKNL